MLSVYFARAGAGMGVGDGIGVTVAVGISVEVGGMGDGVPVGVGGAKTAVQAVRNIQIMQSAKFKMVDRGCWRIGAILPSDLENLLSNSLS